MRNPSNLAPTEPLHGLHMKGTVTRRFLVTYLKKQLNEKLMDHKQHIEKYGEDMPETRNWKWNNPK